MRYTDDDKALMLLSRETSIKKKMSMFDSVEHPRELYDDLSEADEMISQMEELGVVAITRVRDMYPKALLDIYDPPVVLYCRGDVDLLRANILAIVGTRKATRYGKDATKCFVQKFVQRDICIISGLARGIDSAAHRATLEMGGKTIAVVATGLDQVYPAENLELAQSIITEGLMVSEYPIGTGVHAFRFPERNRIISGLSNGVLIPEAGLNSGSLITANCALDQGKELYIIPGSIFASQSKGGNQMLKDLQGTMVTCPEDIVGDDSKVDKEELAVQLTMEQQVILNLLKDDEEVHFTTLIADSKMSVGELSALLSEMEIYGLIRKLSGNYYMRSPKL